ncbi:ROK family protein [Cellulomonas flavigena DSM 20109]|uniref:ROK family protein n=1 Tax=Cellulomonas flavigena (strain ATCC 482 / DSM 20109 / BCRC 11376 / JCM 18109 / NBRC 3775 / NCIMB 8073 / NRS 134) TaxID=446466 RepID=D5UIQ9_CELFN|nr:ROK family protein [Cellulomonas flavigena DSM 20109]
MDDDGRAALHGDAATTPREASTTFPDAPRTREGRAAERVPDPSRAARQAQMRTHNLSMTLAQVVDSTAPPSRAQIAAATGLARGTVTGLVDLLIEAGLVRELDPVVVARAGRPAVPLEVVRGRVAGVGMEVNVDYLGLRAVDLAGGVVAEAVEAADLRGSDPDVVLDRLAALAAPVLAGLATDGVRVAGTALALPGLVDRVTGPLRYAPNLGWRDVDVVARLAAHPGLAALPPRVANEANLAARAEAHARRGEVPPSFLYVSGEVGVGGALVLDGEIFLGRHGWSGEIGHVVVDGGPAGTRPVSLEQHAGQDAIAQAAGLVTGAPFAEVAEAVAAGDARARDAVHAAARWLGLALATVANVVDVSEVVLGGTFGLVYDEVRDVVADTLADRVIFAPWSAPVVSRSAAGDYPAMTGGALAVLRTVVADPTPWFASTTPV